MKGRLCFALLSKKLRSYGKQIAINKQNFLQKAMHTVVRKQLLSLPECTIGKYINFKKDYFEGIKTSKSAETVTRTHMHIVVIQYDLTEEHFFLLVYKVLNFKSFSGSWVPAKLSQAVQVNHC